MSLEPVLNHLRRASARLLPEPLHPRPTGANHRKHSGLGAGTDRGAAS
jgi:hypothetical protein